MRCIRKLIGLKKTMCLWSLSSQLSQLKTCLLIVLIDYREEIWDFYLFSSLTQLRGYYKKLSKVAQRGASL
jgi:hypothetical protein